MTLGASVREPDPMEKAFYIIDVRALTFATLILTNLGLVLVNRSQAESPLIALKRRNPAQWWVAGASIAILSVVIAFQPTPSLFHFGPLHADDLTAAIAVGIAILIALGILKHILSPLRNA
jgi:Ca2+-transporting ATPase